MSRRPVMSRRALLRGTGVALGLPFLASLGWRRRGAAKAGGSAAPRRVMFLYQPNGISVDDWIPRNTGPGYTLSSSLQPLAPIRDKTLVLSGIDNSICKLPRAGDHAMGTAGFLTCRPPDLAGPNLGVSVDQVIAATLQGVTPLPSLHIGTARVGTAGTCDSGFSCAYQANISWASPDQPVPMLVDPQEVFVHLFSDLGSGLSDAEIQRVRAQRGSVLDVVLADAESLRVTLAGDDQRKLDEYLQGIRDLEMKIDGFGAGECTTIDETRSWEVATFTDRVDALLELMVMAFACDRTRVVTCMLDQSGSGRRYNWLTHNGSPIEDSWHNDLSHKQDADWQPKMAAIDRWYVQKFTELGLALDAVVEEDGTTLLDNSMVYFSNEIGDGNFHNHDSLHALLAGGAGGQLRTGRHLDWENQVTLARLFVSMMQMMGLGDTQFALDGTGPAPDLV